MKYTGLLPLLPVLALAAAAPFSVVQVLAQDAAPAAAGVPVSPEEAQGKALRYYEALVKRPTGGYLFDRFYNAWLDTQTLDELEKFLTDRAAAAEAGTGHRLVLAFFYVRQNAGVKALGLFAKALEKDPGNAEAWLQKALAESRAANAEQALKDLEKALGAKPGKETLREARQLQGRLLVRTGLFAEAAKVWESLLAENPADEDLQEDMVEIQLAEGQSDEALKTAQALLEKTKDPYKRVQRRLRVGDIQARLGNRDAAVASYAASLADVGSDSWLEREILSQIDQVYRKDDALAELRGKFEALVKTNPQRVALRRALAKVQAELGDRETALKTWQELLPLAPGNRELREAYVQMLADNKKIEEAVTQMEALIAQEPNDPELLMQLAAFQWGAGKKEECLKTLRQFLTKADQTTEAAALRVAGQMERYEFKDAALALYAETAKKFAASETALLGQAAAMHRAEKKGEARAAWRGLAAGADGPRLNAIARSVAARDEYALAEELMAARMSEFTGDAAFLQFYCETAMRVEKKEGAAVAPARALLNLAKDAVSLDAALLNALRVLDRAGQSAAVLKELQSAAAPAVQEKCLLAALLDKTGETKKADAVLREVAQADAATGYAALVRVYLSRGDFKSAAEAQEALVQAPGGRKAVHLQRLVEFQDKAGLREEALKWIGEWRKTAPGSVLVWIRESDLLTASGKPADALRVMRQAAQQFPGDGDIRRRLGEAFRNEGKYADAMRIYTMLFEEAKDTAEKVRCAGDLAKTAEMSGGMQALLEQFEERRKGNRASILPLLALAEIHRSTNNYQGRRQALLEANRIKQGDPELLLEIARIAEAEGKFDDALSTLQEVKKLDPSGRADERIVQVLFASGRDQEALQLLFNNAGGEKMDPRTAETMAQELMQAGLWEEAEAMLQKFSALHPADYRLGFLYATALLETEQTGPVFTELLRLLEIRNEIVLPAGFVPAQEPFVYRDEYGAYVRRSPAEVARLPAGLAEILRFRSLLSLTATYRQKQSSSPNSNNRTQAAPPASLEDVRDAVLLRCLIFGGEMKAAERIALWKEVAARTSLPRALLDSDGVPLEKFTAQDLEKTATAPGASPLLHAYFIHGYQISGVVLKDAAQAVRGWDAFKDTYPELAWRNLTRLTKETDEASQRALREAAERVKNWPGTPAVADVRMMLNYGLRDIAEKELSPAARDYLSTFAGRAAEWRKVFLQGPDDEKSLAGWLTQHRLSFLERTHVKAWVAFLEEMMNEPPVPPRKNDVKLPRTLLWPLVNNDNLPGQCRFPIARYPEEGMALYVRLQPGYTGSYGRDNQQKPDDAALARYKEALTYAKHPAVRIALRLALEPGNGETVMEEIKAAAQPLFYHDALRASWARQNGRVEEALRILQEAAARPGLTEQEKNAADEFILTMAMEAEHEGGDSPLSYAKMEALTKAAPESARRLAKGMGDGSSFQSLAGMMFVLGLKAEGNQVQVAARAAMMQRQPQSQQPQTRSRVASYYRGGNAQTRAVTLLEKGQRESGLKIITRELRKMSRTDDGMRDDSSWKPWAQVILRFDLEQSVFSAFQTEAAETHPDKLRRQAFAFHVMGKNAESRATWERVLAVNPLDNQALQRVLRPALLEDFPRAQQLFATLRPEQYGAAGTVLTRYISARDENGNNLPISQTALMKLTAEMLERLKPEDYSKASVQWARDLALSFARYGRTAKDNSLPSLFIVPRPKKWQGLEVKAFQQEMDTREELLDRFLAAALKVPGSARDAACIIAAQRVARGAKEEEQLPMIREAMQLAAGASSPVFPQEFYNGSGSDVRGEINIAEAEAFIARRAFATNNPALIDEVDRELKAIAKTAAETAGRPVRSGTAEGESLLVRYRTLYFGTDKEVMDLLKKLGWPGSNQLPELFTAMERRKMEPGLVTLIVARLTPSGHPGSEVFSALTRLLIKVRPEKEAGEWLAKLADIYLGPEDKRAAALAGNQLSHSRSYFLNAFRLRGDAAEKFFLTDHYWRLYGRFLALGRHSRFGGEWETSAGHLFAGASAGERPAAQEVMAVLKVSPFLKDAAAFKVLPRYGAETLFEELAGALAKFDQFGPGVLEEIRTALEPESKQAGPALLLALLKSDKPAAALLDVVAAHEEEFKKLPAEKGAEWVWLRKRITKELKAGALPEPRKSLLEWLEKFTDVKDKVPGAPGEEELRDKFLAAKSFADVGVLRSYDVDSWVQSAFDRMLAAEPQRAGELFKKLRVLYAAAAKSPGGAGRGSSPVNGVTSVLWRRNSAWSSLKSPLPQPLVELRGMMEAWQAPEGYPLSFSLLDRHISSALHASVPRAEGKESTEEETVEFMVKAISEHLEERHGIFIVPSLAGVLFDVNVQDLPGRREHFEKLAASAPESHAHRVLAEALTMVMRPAAKHSALGKEAQAATNARDKAKKAGKSAAEIAALPDPAAISRRPRYEGITDRAKLPAYQQKFLALAEDGSVSLSVRAGVLLQALRRDESMEPPLLLAGLRAQLDLLRSGGQVEEEHVGLFINRLTHWLSQPGVTAPAEVLPLLQGTTAAWRAALRAPSTRFSGGLASPLLDLAILLNDDETIAAVLSTASAQFTPHWMVRLLAAGKVEAAGRIVMNGRESLLDYASYIQAYYPMTDMAPWNPTADAMSRLPALLDSLPSAEYRALAAALVAGFNEASPGVPPQEERMKDATKRLQDCTETTSDAFARALAVVADSEAGRRELAPRIAEAVKDMTLAMLPDSKDQGLAARRGKLMVAHVANRAEAGDFAYAKKEISALARLRPDNSHFRAQLLSGITTRLMTLANASPGEMSAETRAAGRSLWADLLLVPEWPGEDSSSGYGENETSADGVYLIPRLLFHTLALYARDDKMEEWRALLVKQEEPVRKRLRDAWARMRLSNGYQNLVSWPWPKKEEELLKERSRLTVRIIQAGLGLPSFSRDKSPNWLRDCIIQKLVRKEDLLAIADVFRNNGDSLAEGGVQWPRHGGLPAIEIAEFYREAGDKKKAAEWIKTAGKYIDTGDTGMYFDNLHGQAISYQRMGMKPEALAVLRSAKKEMLERPDFRGERRSFYENMLDELDTDELIGAAPEKAAAGLAERVLAAPNDNRVWSKFVKVAERMARQAYADKKWAEAADWRLLASVVQTRVGARDKNHGNAGIALWHAEQAAEALAQSGAEALDYLTVIKKGTKWRYLDNGTVPPPGWRETGFDDSPWPEGAAPLGYGDPGMGTETKPGGTDAKHRAITTVMRRRFDVKDPAALQNLELRYRVDDGCRVFLNGKEILRRDLPKGEIDLTTPATKNITGNDEARWHTLAKVDRTLLQAGANFLAVEVHQDSPASSDMSFDASLHANIRPLEEVYAGYWKRPMSATVQAFWEKLPETFRAVVQKTPEAKVEPEKKKEKPADAGASTPAAAVGKD